MTWFKNVMRTCQFRMKNYGSWYHKSAENIRATTTMTVEQNSLSTYEPKRQETYLQTRTPSEDSDRPAQSYSLINLHWAQFG